MFKMYTILLCVSFLCWSFIYVRTDMFDEGCRHGNGTLTCNFIPHDIPIGVTSVSVTIDVRNTVTIEQSNFSTISWSTVTSLELAGKGKDPSWLLQDACFVALKQLQELKLHITNHLHMDSDAFVGLDLVNTLDVSGCVRLNISSLESALNGSNKLPGLNKLVLSDLLAYNTDANLDKTFFNILVPRKIHLIDISNSQISTLDVSASLELTRLEFINASFANVGQLEYNGVSRKDLMHWKMLDLANIALPKQIMPLRPGILVYSNGTYNYSEIRYSNIMILLAPETLNISGIINEFTFVIVQNITIILDVDPLWYTKTFLLKQNNLNRMNAIIICNDFNISSIEFLDISDNGMEFIHPTILSCMPNLHKVYLSKNKLYKMVQEDVMLFENLFLGLRYLNGISLAVNELHTIPLRMFQYCRSIENIDLSFNKLDQVTFTLNDLDHLMVLDLRGNDIHVLDPLSINRLNTIPHGTDPRGDQVTVTLTSNPISCSQCNAKHFIQWILSTNVINTTSQKLSCFNEDGKEEAINDNTVEIVQRICDRRTIIISTSVSTGVILLLVTVCTLIIYKRSKAKQKIKKITNVINLLREGGGQYQFGVFLSFSHEDEEFVNAEVLDQLNKNLQLMTGIDRELVCTGDRQFRPGFYVHNEAFRNLDTASVLLVVVSNNFCTSVYCRNELDQAYVKQKPIVLMFMEHIDLEAMMPTMKELYLRNVRILWTVENEEYVLKTTWENVCTSILELIQCDL